MTAVVADRPRARLGPAAALTVAVGLAAWVGFVLWARDMDMGAEPGTMGLSLIEFVLMWTVMMAAMMLPATAPLMSLYARSVGRQPPRLVAFGAGYVVAWAATGLAAFALAAAFDRLADDHAGTAHAVAVTALAGSGLYQLTPMKRWCLRHCRSPIAHLLHYASYTGRTRDLRAGTHHGLLCIGCCWMMMVALVVVGVMNLPVMLGLAVVIALEKRWRHGEVLAKVAGVAAIVFAVAVAFDADLAPGLHDSGVPMQMDEMEMG